MSDYLPEEELLIPSIELGVYEHYKGNRYEVLGVGLDTEDRTPLVIYKPVKESKVPFWVRPYDMFISQVVVDGKEIARFRKI